MPDDETIRERLDRETKEQIAASRKPNVPETRDPLRYHCYRCDQVSEFSPVQAVTSQLYCTNPVCLDSPENPVNRRHAQVEVDADETEGLPVYRVTGEQPIFHNVDPSLESKSFVKDALAQLEGVLVSKGADYAEGGEFENFEEQARTAGDVTIPQVFRGMLGQKLNREKTLRHRAELGAPRNESRLDTIRDIAGYAVLWFAYELQEESQHE